MNVRQSSVFGPLLQEYRLRAGLTQEALAARAGLGRRSIQGLERGENAPQRETVLRLVQALALSPDEQSRFEAVAQPVARRQAGTSSRREQTPGQNLPAPLTSFIGRERELAEIKQLLTLSRLITLTGPPGTGKTRAAEEVARAASADFADGVWVVPLAALSDPDLVPSAIAQRLRLPETPGRLPSDVIAARLQSKSALLVLDNFEQVIDAGTQLSHLLEACPRLRVLVTSRSALRVRGEQIYPVLPLAAPDRRAIDGGENLEQYPAVRLFVDRARASTPVFGPTLADLRAIAEICLRLDGLPLAIELAAARSTILAPPAMLARMEHPLGLLSGGAHDLPARQQTLRAAIDWSYKLLDSAEQAFFRCLAVFSGGWSVDAAAEVAAEDRVSSILDLLESLVNKSLVRSEAQTGFEEISEPRFGMLETLREYAGERLVESGKHEAARKRHASYFLALAEDAGPKAYGQDASIWLDRLEADHDNFRAALRWAEEHGEAETSLRLGTALYRFWWLRQHATEGSRWLERALAGDTGRRSNDDPRARLARARALHAAGIIASTGVWNYVAAQTLLEESLTILRVVGDRRSVANSLHNLAIVVGNLGDLSRAWSLCEESLALWRELGELWGLTAVLRVMATLALAEADNDRGRRIAEECLAFARVDGFTFHIAQALSCLGQVAFRQGDSAMACFYLEESLAIFRDLGSRHMVADARCFLAQVALQMGDSPRARLLLTESLPVYRELGLPVGVALALDVFAELAVAEDRPARALRLAGAAASARAGFGKALSLADRAPLQRALATARQTLGKDGALVALSSGRAMTEEQAVAYALADGAD